jgi:hypothetical protein
MNLNRDYDRVGFAKEFLNVMGMILVGAGQVGGIIGGRLVRAGHELTFCDVDREHVRDVKHPGVASHVVVLIDLRTIVDGHLPTRKIHQARVAAAMLFEQRGPLEIRGAHAKKMYSR